MMKSEEEIRRRNQLAWELPSLPFQCTELLPPCTAPMAACSTNPHYCYPICCSSQDHDLNLMPLSLHRGVTTTYTEMEPCTEHVPVLPVCYAACHKHAATELDKRGIALLVETMAPSVRCLQLAIDERELSAMLKRKTKSQTEGFLPQKQNFPITDFSSPIVS